MTDKNQTALAGRETNDELLCVDLTTLFQLKLLICKISLLRSSWRYHDNTVSLPEWLAEALQCGKSSLVEKCVAGVSHWPEELGIVLAQETSPLRPGVKCQLETFNSAGMAEALD